MLGGGLRPFCPDLRQQLLQEGCSELNLVPQIPFILTSLNLELLPPSLTSPPLHHTWRPELFGRIGPLYQEKTQIYSISAFQKSFLLLGGQEALL